MIDQHARVGALHCCLAISVLALTACGSSTPTVNSENLRVASSAEDAGGMDALIATAQKEGTLNAIALPRDWANYGAVIDGFSNKYGIEVKVAQPDASSQDEIDAVKRYQGQPEAPDVLDMGRSFAQSAAEQGLLAPYKVKVYNKIPDNQKDPLARWSNNYGGYVSIGCDAAEIEECPQTFDDLRKPEYLGKVSLNGEPTKAGSAFAGVYAASLANKGSLDDIKPGLEFFEDLTKSENFNPVQSTPATIESGETPISIDWDYLNTSYADSFREKGMDWQVTVPSDGIYAEYYSQAINKDAPHPAAARLWQEYVFSEEGQNLRLEGYARPVLMDSMKRDGTLHEIAAAWLPSVDGKPKFPSEEQTSRAKEIVAKGWRKAVSRN
ncbi:extracellular solute-binding protein [Streptomyces sp. NPDC051776]|uniref:ABC transporter substrate-binding protein n=1 Tax=Streptomyces sp. NPDC051776 TaxID=3155414 RepID=UPI003435BB8F